MSSLKGYSIIEGCVRQSTMNPIKKEYSISLGITDEEISNLKNGEPVSFIFSDKDFPKINVAIEHKGDDLPLSDYMNLRVDNIQEQV